MWRICSNFFQTETLHPRRGLSLGTGDKKKKKIERELRKWATHKSQEVPETYKTHKALSDDVITNDG